MHRIPEASGAIGILALAIALGPQAYAAEGASSHYLPGTAGDFAIALPPAPGFQMANTVWMQTGSIGSAVLEGAVRLDLDLDLYLDLLAATYTFETPVENLTYTIGAVVPFGYGELNAKLVGPLGGTLSVGDDAFELSDIAFIPAQVNWKTGTFSFKLAEVIVAPTGGYDKDDLMNLGRNYWSFDTVGAVTWFDPERGSEVSIAPGIMFNTENNATNYKTGTEFHIDFTGNQFLSETFAIGVQGYYYQQVTGDSGSGAVLGNFKSESFAIGPGFLWSPGFAEGRLTVFGHWMHDLHSKHRFESDYVTLGAAWKF